MTVLPARISVKNKKNVAIYKNVMVLKKLLASYFLLLYFFDNFLKGPCYNGSGLLRAMMYRYRNKP